MREINRVAIVGMGALGLLYGERIAAVVGNGNVFFVADEERVNRYQNAVFTINGTVKEFQIVSAQEAETADLVIVAVKYNGLFQALDIMKNCVGEMTTIISVMNGISSEDIIGACFGKEKVLYTIAQAMDAMKLGYDLNYTRYGELRIGIKDTARKERLDKVIRFLERANIPYVVEADIIHRLWSKFMVNVGINQTCMAYEATYGEALVPGEAYDTVLGAMREVIALSHLEQVDLTEHDLENYIEILKTLSPDGAPSMRQDGIMKRPSEVEMFAGTVLKMAKKHGLSVPVNDMLYKRIKEMEAYY